MGQTKKLRVTLTEVEDGLHVLSWQDDTFDRSQPITRTVTVQEIESDFPEFCNSIRECHSLLNPAVDVNQLVLCAAYSYAENIMKKK